MPGNSAGSSISRNPRTRSSRQAMRFQNAGASSEIWESVFRPKRCVFKIQRHDARLRLNHHAPLRRAFPINSRDFSGPCATSASREIWQRVFRDKRCVFKILERARKSGHRFFSAINPSRLRRLICNQIQADCVNLIARSRSKLLE
jgi:hypothetical protein